MILLAPSIMAGNHLNFQHELNQITEYADVVHLDIMDGHFVPNIGLGIKTCEQICASSTIPCYAHLMVNNPMDYLERFRNMGADTFVWHIEVQIDHKRKIEEVKESGMKAGLAISPDTDTGKLEGMSQLLDVITVMGVIPGRSGQSFIPETIDRVSRIRSLPGNFKLEVDGGVSLDNAEQLVKAGADILVSGSSFMKNKEKRLFADTIHNLRR